MADNALICWELASHDQDRSAEFFRAVFGWEVVFDEGIGFWRANPPVEGNPGKGYVFTLKRAKLPFLTVYIKVKDIKAMRDRVVEQGGFIVMEPEEVLPGDFICLFNEPSGVTFAMIQSGPISNQDGR